MKYCQVNSCRYNRTHITSGHRCGNCHQYGHGIIECDDLDRINHLKDNFHHERLPSYKWCKKTGCRFFWSHTCDAHHCSICGDNHSQIDCPNLNSDNNIENNTINDTSDNTNIDSNESDDSIMNEVIVDNFSSEDFEDLSTNESMDTSEEILSSSVETIESELVSTSILVNDTNGYSSLDNENISNNSDNKINSDNNKIIKLDCPICRKDNNVSFNKHRAYGITNKCNVCMTDNIEIFLPDCGHTILCRKCCLKIGNIVDEIPTISPTISNNFTSITTPYTHFPYPIVGSPIPSESLPSAFYTTSSPTISPTVSPTISPTDTHWYEYEFSSPISTPSVSESIIYPVPTPSPPSPITITNSIEHLFLINIDNFPASGQTQDFPSEKISEVLNIFGLNPGPIYTYIYAGMGCGWYIRRSCITSNNWEVFFMHLDAWGQYGDDTNVNDMSILNEFKTGYTPINNNMNEINNSSIDSNDDNNDIE
jgi:hypothetical protein